MLTHKHDNNSSLFLDRIQRLWRLSHSLGGQQSVSLAKSALAAKIQLSGLCGFRYKSSVLRCVCYKNLIRNITDRGLNVDDIQNNGGVITDSAAYLSKYCSLLNDRTNAPAQECSLLSSRCSCYTKYDDGQ